MKKLPAFLTILFVLSVNVVSAQINVNVNIGSQPMWGPAGYNYVNYYYLPEIETYYSVPKRQFIYLNNGQWLFSSALPSRYRGYDLNNGYKIILNNPQPYLSFKTHKVKYAKYKSYRGKQPTLRYSKSKKVSSGYPKYSGNSGGSQSKGNGKQASRNGNGNGKSNSGKGNGKH